MNISVFKENVCVIMKAMNTLYRDCLHSLLSSYNGLPVSHFILMSEEHILLGLAFAFWRLEIYNPFNFGWMSLIFFVQDLRSIVSLDVKGFMSLYSKLKGLLSHRWRYEAFCALV